MFIQNKGTEDTQFVIGPTIQIGVSPIV